MTVDPRFARLHDVSAAARADLAPVVALPDGTGVDVVAALLARWYADTPTADVVIVRVGDHVVLITSRDHLRRFPADGAVPYPLRRFACVVCGAEEFRAATDDVADAVCPVGHGALSPAV